MARTPLARVALTKPRAITIARALALRCAVLRDRADANPAERSMIAMELVDVEQELDRIITLITETWGDFLSVLDECQRKER